MSRAVKTASRHDAVLVISVLVSVLAVGLGAAWAADAAPGTPQTPPADPAEPGQAQPAGAERTEPGISMWPPFER